jgi:D-alanine-D-alanine ligase
MKYKINPDWWKVLFDEVYLLTDARTVCNDDLTRKEVDFITGFMGIAETSPVLDLCGGQGRHSLEMARRGFTDLTVLDYSMFLIELGRNRACKESLNVTFIHGDARNTGLKDQSYQHIILMASSFGYFTDDQENMKILTESFRLLRPKGKLLLDLPDRDYVLNNFKPSSIHRVNDDINVKRQRVINNNVIYSKETVLSDQEGCIRENTYCTRLYSRDDLRRIIPKAGFQTVAFEKDFMNRAEKGDFGCMTNRMVVIAEKG